MERLTKEQTALLFKGAWEAHADEPDSVTLSLAGYAQAHDTDAQGWTVWHTTRAGYDRLGRIIKADRQAWNEGQPLEMGAALEQAEATFLPDLYPATERAALVALEAYRLMVTPPQPTDRAAELARQKKQPAEILAALLEGASHE